MKNFCEAKLAVVLLFALCATAGPASASPSYEAVPDFRGTLGSDANVETSATAAEPDDATEPFELTTQAGEEIIPHGKCHYFLEKARSTGEASFLQRYRACESN